MTHYFLPVGEELMWFNDDFVDHKLILMNEDNTTKILDLDLPANSSASYKFQQPGKYYYSSEIYPKIQGSIKVLDPNNISVEKITGLKNGIDVQLAWISSQITLEKNSPDPRDVASGGDEAASEGETRFIITFINNETGTNQEHLDYDFTIVTGNSVFNRASHSTYGIEEATYNFDKSGSFDAQVMITQILFAPVNSDIAQFQKSITIS